MFITKKLKIIALLLLMAGAVSITVPPVAVHADPPDIGALQEYCKDKMPKSSQSQCSAGNISRIRNSVNKKCKDKKNVQACVTDAVKDVINRIAKKKPQDKKQFQDALDNELKSDEDDAQGGQPGHCTASNNCDLVRLYVNPFIRVLTIAVGLVVAASLIMGGIQYSTAGSDPQKTSAAKSRITNTLLAFIAYAFLYAFLNFLVPGGIFNG